MLISDLRETVKIKEDMVERLKGEINSLQESLENMKRDLEQKAKDMIRLRKEMNRALKYVLDLSLEGAKYFDKILMCT